jgi:hypothetical protein
MPDGKRKRRHSEDEAKRRWYALHRARRFKRRFWMLSDKPAKSAPFSSSRFPIASSSGCCSPVDGERSDSSGIAAAQAMC